MKHLPPALFLDLDDTIIDYDATENPLWELVCKEVGPQIGVDGHILHHAVMGARNWVWHDNPDWARGHKMETDERIAQLALRQLGRTAAHEVACLANAYRFRRDNAVGPLPGALDALVQFRAAGSRLVMITNGSSQGQRAKIRRFELAHYFDHILIEGEFGFGKPDFRIFRKALELTGAKPSDAWMVGDHLYRDVVGAQACGIKGIWLDADGVGLPSDLLVKPDRIIRSLFELLQPEPSSGVADASPASLAPRPLKGDAA